MSQPITAVVGLPRSGTTMMMHMLHAGGMEVYADNMDSFETIKNMELPKYDAFLYDCRGKAVKILDPLYFKPPGGKHNYRFIWMWRNPADIVKSQYKFFKHLQPNTPPLTLQSMVRLSNKADTDYLNSKALLASYKNSKMLVVSFAEALEDPLKTADIVAEFLDKDFDTYKMAAVVADRGPECCEGFLEYKLAEDAA